MAENRVKVKDLKPGMRLNLEGDKYADSERDHADYEFEYKVVADIILETADCIVLELEDGNSVGFPPDHEVLVEEEKA